MTLWSRSVWVRLEGGPGSGGGCWLPGISCTEANFNLNANVITIQTDWTSTSVSASVDSLPPLCNTSECLNAYNGLTNEYLCSCLFTENQFVLSRKSREPWNVLRRTARGLHDGWILKKSVCVCYLTRHSRSLAGREMMMRSFLANSVTKATSELSERS